MFESNPVSAYFGFLPSTMCYFIMHLKTVCTMPGNMLCKCLAESSGNPAQPKVMRRGFFLHSNPTPQAPGQMSVHDQQVDQRVKTTQRCLFINWRISSRWLRDGILRHDQLFSWKRKSVVSSSPNICTVLKFSDWKQLCFFSISVK